MLIGDQHRRSRIKKPISSLFYLPRSLYSFERLEYTSTIKMAQEKPETKPDEDEKSFQYNKVPEEEAWLLSQLLYSWQRPLFRRASDLIRRGRALEQDDLLPLPKIDFGEVIGPKFEDAWQKRAGVAEPTINKLEDLKGDTDMTTTRIQRTLLDVMGPRFYVAGVIKMINSALQFCFPLLLNAILKFIEETQAGLIDDTAPWHERYRGYWLSAILLLTMASKAVTENAYFHRVVRCGFQAKAAVSVAVYNKSLRLTNAERQSTTLGKYNNLGLCTKHFTIFPHTIFLLTRRRTDQSYAS